MGAETSAGTLRTRQLTCTYTSRRSRLWSRPAKVEGGFLGLSIAYTILSVLGLLSQNIPPPSSSQIVVRPGQTCVKLNVRRLRCVSLWRETDGERESAFARMMFHDSLLLRDRLAPFQSNLVAGGFAVRKRVIWDRRLHESEGAFCFVGRVVRTHHLCVAPFWDFVSISRSAMSRVVFLRGVLHHRVLRDMTKDLGYFGTENLDDEDHLAKGNCESGCAYNGVTDAVTNLLMKMQHVTVCENSVHNSCVSLTVVWTWNFLLSRQT